MSRFRIRVLKTKDSSWNDFPQSAGYYTYKNIKETNQAKELIKSNLGYYEVRIIEIRRHD